MSIPVKIYQLHDPVVISPDNHKLGKIPNVGLPPIITCPPRVPCAKEGLCYSLKAWRQYPQVKFSRLHNWNVWNAEPIRYFNDIKEYVERHNTQYFRFHTDGDIPNEDYFIQMIDLAIKCPNTDFLAYTKRYELPLRECPKNLVVVPSAWPGWDIPLDFKSIAWMEDGREDRHCNRPVFNCKKKCDACYACWNLNKLKIDVVFHKH